LVLLFATVPASIAAYKGQSAIGWYVYGVLFSLIALVHALLLKPDEAVLERRRQKLGAAMQNTKNRACPNCSEFMRPEIQVCGLCGGDMNESPILRGEIVT